MSSPTTRNQIVEAADQLFYQQGFDHTSFADIAGTVKISRGNFYYHFKTKNEILAAVINTRLANTRQMLDQWETDVDTPEGRIRSFIHILIENRDKIMEYGCPIGTLCAELAKLDHAAQPDANKLFTLFYNWLRQQFTHLGHAENADELAMHLLARSQGVAALATAFHDEEFIRHEVNLMCDWLKSCSQNDPTKPDKGNPECS